MTTALLKSAKTVGAYEAKTKLGELLDLVERGREITITRHAKDVARLVPASGTAIDRTVYTRIRALRSRISLEKEESVRDLINEGRRI
jgi:prevent-host-death family protein